MQNKRTEAIYYTIKKRCYLKENVTGQAGSAELQGERCLEAINWTYLCLETTIRVNIFHDLRRNQQTGEKRFQQFSINIDIRDRGVIMPLK